MYEWLMNSEKVFCSVWNIQILAVISGYVVQVSSRIRNQILKGYLQKMRRGKFSTDILHKLKWDNRT